MQLFQGSAPWTAPWSHTCCPSRRHARVPSVVLKSCQAEKRQCRLCKVEDDTVDWQCFVSIVAFSPICIYIYVYTYICIHAYYFRLSPKWIFKAEVVSKTSVSSNHLPEVWKDMEKLQSLYRGTKGKRGDRTEHDGYVNALVHTKMHHIKISFMDRHRLSLWNHFIIKTNFNKQL